MKTIQNPKPAITLLNVNNPTDSQYKAIIAQASQSPCLLCGGVPDTIGIFSPVDSSQYGAGPGRAKQFFYPICQACMNAEGWMERIEKLLESKSKGDCAGYGQKTKKVLSKGFSDTRG